MKACVRPAIVLLIAIAGALLSLGSTSSNPWVTSPLSADDRQIHELVLSKLHSVNQTQMEAAGLARHKAESRSVRRFADRVYRDHKLADARINKVAQKANLSVRTIEPADNKEARQLDDLKALEGPAFDRAFVTLMERDHSDIVDLVKSYSTDLDKTQTGNLLAKLAPVFEQELSLANRIDQRLTGR